MIVEKPSVLSFCEINATKFGSKNCILHIIIYHSMTSYGYIIMTLVNSCMIWFHCDCIMQMKKSFHIATNVCSRKSATICGDLPYCWSWCTLWRCNRNIPSEIALIVELQYFTWLPHLIYMGTLKAAAHIRATPQSPLPPGDLNSISNT